MKSFSAPLPKTLGKSLKNMLSTNGIKLNETLKNFANLSDQSILISKLRLVKSETELNYIRMAAQ